jgi:hypothetical protein
MGKKMVITVRWMDGQTDTYDDVSNHYEENGILTIRRSRGWFRRTPRQTWNLSLANIRTFDVEWQRRESRSLQVSPTSR